MLRHDLNADLQGVLIDVGAVKANDHRVQRPKQSEDEHIECKLRRGNKTNTSTSDDSDDWD